MKRLSPVLLTLLAAGVVFGEAPPAKERPKMPEIRRR